MKSKAELEQIAREIVLEWVDHPNATVDNLEEFLENPYEFARKITEALQRVQDEAIKEAFPVLTAQLSKANEALNAPREYPSYAEMIEAKKAFSESRPELNKHSIHDAWYACYDWLRANMRPANERSELPAPQMPSWQECVAWMTEYRNEKHYDCNGPEFYAWLRANMKPAPQK